MNGEANEETCCSLSLETVDDNVSDLPDDANPITEQPSSYMHDDESQIREHLSSLFNDSTSTNHSLDEIEFLDSDTSRQLSNQV